MTHLTTERQPSTPTFLGVWEKIWQDQADQERKAERYRTWLCSQGASRDNAAEQVVRVLAQGSKAVISVTQGCSQASWSARRR